MIWQGRDTVNISDILSFLMQSSQYKFTRDKVQLFKITALYDTSMEVFLLFLDSPAISLQQRIFVLRLISANL